MPMPPTDPTIRYRTQEVRGPDGVTRAMAVPIYQSGDDKFGPFTAPMPVPSGIINWYGNSTNEPVAAPASGSNLHECQCGGDCCGRMGCALCHPEALAVRRGEEAAGRNARA